MKYLKLYEEFDFYEEDNVLSAEPEIDTDEFSYIDYRGVIHIKNWTKY